IARAAAVVQEPNHQPRADRHATPPRGETCRLASREILLLRRRRDIGHDFLPQLELEGDRSYRQLAGRRSRTSLILAMNTPRISCTATDCIVSTGSFLVCPVAHTRPVRFAGTNGNARIFATTRAQNSVRNKADSSSGTLDRSRTSLRVLRHALGGTTPDCVIR